MLASNAESKTRPNKMLSRWLSRNGSMSVLDGIVLASDVARDLDAALQRRVTHDLTTLLAVLRLEDAQHGITAAALVGCCVDHAAFLVRKTREPFQLN